MAWNRPVKVDAARKKHGNESDRLAYRAVCQQANKFINASRNRYRCQRVVDASKHQGRHLDRTDESAVQPLSSDQSFSGDPLLYSSD